MIRVLIERTETQSKACMSMDCQLIKIQLSIKVIIKKKIFSDVSFGNSNKKKTNFLEDKSVYISQ